VACCTSYTHHCRVGQNHIYTVYIRFFGREITLNTVIYGEYIWFWPILHLCIGTFQKKVCDQNLNMIHTQTALEHIEVSSMEQRGRGSTAHCQ